MSNLLKFTEHNLQAIKAGRKTQTRRPIKPQPGNEFTRVELLENGLWSFRTEFTKDVHDYECPCEIGNIVQLAKFDGTPVDTRVRITGIRVERVQDISDENAIAEGIERSKFGQWKDYSSSYLFSGWLCPKNSFKSLWNTIYGPEHQFSWSANPWCWVYEFEVVT